MPLDNVLESIQEATVREVARIIGEGRAEADVIGREAEAKYKKEMKPSCTLTIFVTDHGTGYNPKQGWHGARAALPGTTEHKEGKTYPETAFKFDMRRKVYRGTDSWVTNGKRFKAFKDEAGRTEIWKKVGTKYQLVGWDKNGDGWIVEGEFLIAPKREDVNCA